jgi:hypothetical protein
MATEREWPRVKRDPVAYFTSPNGYHRSDHELVGPLRTGTTPEAGPKGYPVKADRSFLTDYGMDRIDPTASHDLNKGSKDPPPAQHSDLIARVIRRRDD